jgi:hypothetical protein
MAVQIKLTARIFDLDSSFVISDTFTLPKVNIEHVDDKFLDDFLRFAATVDCTHELLMNQSILIDDICVRGMDENGNPVNNLFAQVSSLNGRCLDWRVIKSKTKIKAL